MAEIIQRNEPYQPSGFLMEEPHAVEITLCMSPAVAGAKFRVVRAAGEDQAKQLKLQMPIRSSNKEQRQVFGYVSTPWLEDWYGDVMDPNSIEHAAKSYMKNMQTGNVAGNGVGEEHVNFWDTAYVFESVVDRSGKLAGIPYGWWVGVQIEDNTTWEKVQSGTYTGFSLGSYVRFVHTGNPHFKEDLWQNIPDMRSIRAAKPGKGKYASMDDPGAFGYPTEASRYADPSNNKYPIDTRSRAYATLRYVLQSYKFEGYDIDELKYMVRRQLAAIALTGDEIARSALDAVGFKTLDSAKDYAAEMGLKPQSVAPEDDMIYSPTTTEPTHKTISKEDEESMELTQKDQATIQSIVDASLKPVLEKLASIQTPVADSAPVAPDEGAPVQEDTKQQSFDIHALVDALAARLQERSAPADAPAPVTQTAPVEPKAQAEPVSELVSTITETTLKALTPVLQGITDQVAVLAKTIGEIPVQRSTALQGAPNTVKEQRKAELLAKIQSGLDFNAKDWSDAHELGIDVFDPGLVVADAAN